MSPRSHEHDGQCNAIHTVADMTTVHFGERGRKSKTSGCCALYHWSIMLAYVIVIGLLCLIRSSPLEKKCETFSSIGTW